MKFHIRYNIPFYITFLALFCSHFASAETATGILDKTANKLTAAKTFSADFSMSGGDGEVNGSMYVDGDKFAMTSNLTSIWYDGKTQWSAAHDIEELTIFEPTAEEIAQINPIAIIKNYKNDFSCRLLSSSASLYSIELIPTDKTAPFSKIMLTISASNYMPSKIVTTMRDGNTITLKITNIKTGINLNPSVFVCNKKSLGGYEIIDLR